MTKDEARRHAEGLALAMGIPFFVVRNPQGDFLAVQVAPDNCEIIATVEPPEDVEESRRFDCD